MSSSIFSIFRSVFINVWNWFEALLTSTGMRGIMLALFSIFFSVSFLILPLRGQSGSSDKAKKKNDHEE